MIAVTPATDISKASLARELRKKIVYEDDLSLMMIVKDQAGQTVLSLPFFPGC